MLEETGVKGSIREYLGHINYQYKSMFDEKIVDKTVHWYLMNANNTNTAPQRDEGFKDAVFIHKDNVVGILKHKDEIEIIERALINID